MNISAINNQTSFGMLMGKKDVTYHHGKDTNTISTVQHLYPFKDEFKSAEEVERALTQFKRSSFYKEQNEPDSDTKELRKYSLALEKTLPFTREEFCRTLIAPKAYNSSKAAFDFMRSKEYDTTTIKHTGLLCAKIVNEGNIEYVV